MKEFRRDVDNGPDTRFHWAVLGPIPELPPWHLQSEVTQYPFPTEAAAVRFAQNHKAQHLGVTIRYPDGRRWSGKEWL